MVNAVIRRAKAQDIDAIAALWAALVTYHRALDEELPTATPDGSYRYARRILNHIDDPSACVLIAQVDDKVVGYVLGVVVDLAPEMFTYDPSGFLADIYVDEAHRRGGIGRALVNELVNWFRSRGLNYYEWHAASRNPDGIAFWRAMGGHEIMLRMRAPIADDSGSKGQS